MDPIAALSHRNPFNTILVPSTKLARCLTVRLYPVRGIPIRKGLVTVRRPSAPETNSLDVPGNRVFRQCSPLSNPYNDQIRSDDLCSTLIGQQHLMWQHIGESMNSNPSDGQIRSPTIDRLGYKKWWKRDCVKGVRLNKRCDDCSSGRVQAIRFV